MAQHNEAIRYDLTDTEFSVLIREVGLKEWLPLSEDAKQATAARYINWRPPTDHALVARQIRAIQGICQRVREEKAASEAAKG